MTREQHGHRSDDPQPLEIRMPRLTAGEPLRLGAGDAVRRVTSAIGLKHCGGCARRAAQLNKWVVVVREQRRQ